MFAFMNTESGMLCGFFSHDSTVHIELFSELVELSVILNLILNLIASFFKYSSQACYLLMLRDDDIFDLISLVEKSINSVVFFLEYFSVRMKQ